VGGLVGATVNYSLARKTGKRMKEAYSKLIMIHGRVNPHFLQGFV
jgi:hypothetical protein